MSINHDSVVLDEGNPLISLVLHPNTQGAITIWMSLSYSLPVYSLKFFRIDFAHLDLFFSEEYKYTASRHAICDGFLHCSHIVFPLSFSVKSLEGALLGVLHSVFDYYQITLSLRF